MRIKIFTCASMRMDPHMRIIRMNRMDPQPHGQAYFQHPSKSSFFAQKITKELINRDFILWSDLKKIFYFMMGGFP